MRILFIALVTAVTAGAASADDAAKAERKARIEKYIEMGQSGVYYKEETDVKNGVITQAYIVGTASISSVLGEAEGLELAKEKAEESAKSAFVKWLGSSVTVRKTVKEEILLTTEGADGELKESGKKVERRTKEFDETASAMVRGMKLVGTSQSGKEKKFIIVYRWEPGLAPAKGDGSETPAKGKNAKDGSKIPDKTIIIDD